MNKALLLSAGMLVTACGGGGGYDSGSGTSARLMYTIGGTVSGLNAGGTVVLQNNGANNLAVSQNGAFAFSAPLDYANGYDVSVLTQPAGQTCTVANGAGAYPGMSVTNVQVTCR